MARKTRTVVPKDLLVGTSPPVKVSLARPIELRIVGKKDRVIARLEIGRKRVRVLGAREWKAKSWSYRELQLEGVSEA